MQYNNPGKKLPNQMPKIKIFMRFGSYSNDKKTV